MSNNLSQFCHRLNMYPNIKKVTNSVIKELRIKILERLLESPLNKNIWDKTITINLEAECQSGKTAFKAALVAEIDLLLTELSEKFQRNPKTSAFGTKSHSVKTMIWSGTTDSTLCAQHFSSSSELMTFQYLKNNFLSEVYLTLDRSVVHYSKSKGFISAKYREIESSINKNDKGFIVLCDEAHIGAGINSKWDDFRKTLNEIPSQVPKIMITTSATCDFLSGRTRKDLEKYFDILGYMKPGELYWGAKDALNSTRVKDIKENNFEMKNLESAVKFVEEFVYPIYSQSLNTKNYKVLFLRLGRNASKSRMYFKEALEKVWDQKERKSPPEINYFSTTKTEKSYEECLSYIGSKIDDDDRKSLTKPEIFVVKDGIQQGVSIDKSKIGLWFDMFNYESQDDFLPDGMSKHVQRTGRNFGYDVGNASYPIFCNTKVLKHYVEAMERSENWNNGLDENLAKNITGTHVRSSKTKSKADWIVNIEKLEPISKIQNEAISKYKALTNSQTNKRIGLIRSNQKDGDFWSEIRNNRFNSYRTNATPITGKKDKFVQVIYIDKREDDIYWDNEIKSYISGNLQNMWCLLYTRQKRLNNNNDLNNIKTFNNTAMVN